MAVKRRGTNKNPPILSHEFVIQNHADIVAGVAMVFVLCLMFQVSSPLASVFIALHHNTTIPVEVSPGNTVDTMYYISGLKDIPAVFFYLLIVIVMHQIIQEYILDKVNRKLHLSKIKHSKFNESGQLLCFYLASVVWAVDIMIRENISSLKMLWEGYPHVNMSFLFKFFYIIQIAYWLHIFPELYFQRTRKEDMASRIQYASLYLTFIIGAYAFSYNRLGLCLIILQYVAEGLFHACRLLSYSDKENLARPLYRIHDFAFVLARLGSISLAVLTFWHGLALIPKDEQIINISTRTFNTFQFRTLAMMAVCLLQAWLMWNFITFHLRRMRENRGSQNGTSSFFQKTNNKKTQQEKAKARKEKPRRGERGDDNDLDDELPEVDQNTKKTLRQRK